ncbi:hypothetical protein JOQ06_023727 [Pogonophryne albipinna]|uniref:Uncharacterized protein n=1 Tax=Pogonophryne albipinna TaxID=1090488 RepID=A0AAD6FU63_9TELE|nr:hypothetical protein JOQ06_023727 [Pogonophryne albipinna]
MISNTASHVQRDRLVRQCKLEFQGCLSGKTVSVKCDGLCPCLPGQEHSKPAHGTIRLLLELRSRRATPNTEDDNMQSMEDKGRPQEKRAGNTHTRKGYMRGIDYG